MTPALSSAQYGLFTAGKRFGAAAGAFVTVSAAPSTAPETLTRLAIQAADGTLGGDGWQRGRLPLPDGLLLLLQDGGWSQGRGRSGAAPTPERALAGTLLARNAFEANLRAFRAADEQLGTTLDLIA